MFKRRPRSYTQIATELVFPRGGWRRALSYLSYRLRRLPDPPERIGRGIAAGVFVSFTPFFGLHLFLSMLFGYLIRGNIFAAAIGSLIGNPLTFPFIAVLCVGIGQWMLGIHGEMAPGAILASFSGAGAEVWRNMFGLLTGGEAHWARLGHFWDVIFLPYLLGGLLPGVATAIVCHYLAVPVVRAFHQRRAAHRLRRAAKRAEGLPDLVADPDAAPPAPRRKP